MRGSGERWAVEGVCGQPGVLVFPHEDVVSLPVRLEGAGSCSPEPAIVQVLPAGRGRGVARLPRQPASPQRGSLLLWPCQDGDAASPVARYLVRVQPDGRFEVALPTGCWQVALSLPGFASAVAGPVAVRAELPALPAGTWQVRVVSRVAGGDDCLSTIPRPLVEVPGGATVDLELDLSHQVVEGRVERSGDRVEGELLFVRMEGHSLAALHRTRSDQEGRFAALIEQAGSYGVEVTGLSPAGRWWIPDVALELDGREVVLLVPTGELLGVVVDEEGSRLANAHVRAEGLVEGKGGSGGRPMPRLAALHKGSSLSLAWGRGSGPSGCGTTPWGRGRATSKRWRFLGRVGSVRWCCAALGRKQSVGG